MGVFVLCFDFDKLIIERMYFIMCKNILWNFAFPTYQKFVASIDSNSFKKMSQSHGLIGDIKVNYPHLTPKAFEVWASIK